MNYILFEDKFAHFLQPFTDMHASFEVRCGQFTHLERLINLLDPTDSLTLIVRKEIEELITHRFENMTVNPELISSGIWLNGSTIWDDKLIQKVSDGKNYANNDILFAFSEPEKISIHKVKDLLISKIKITSQIEFPHISFLWDSISESHHQIEEDFLKNFQVRHGKIHHSVIMVIEEKIHCAENTEIKAGVILDASNGPIIIEENVKIDIGALLQGPIVIGKNSTINPGTKLRGNVVIGPRCKIGGEIEDSIIHGFSNKQHDGFLGHSYVGEWVNLGANTNNSDLKNTYGKIKFKFPKIEIPTGEMFIGAMIGDFVRTGISTMLNTGTYIGTGANIFGGDFQKKHISPFCWGDEEIVHWAPFLETCNRMKKRRNAIISLPEKNRLKFLYKSI
jgi:UDP-N-acetylglucosamine diphosphorylase / glucose-1-phosphate thymidylyltransferase / UDP-N-acetylgalactosamine diphosphorylase / glucosamine-1-phosphate N-acetyltransferase / galactosamine-1-phosphate N-acetyltransferase